MKFKKTKRTKNGFTMVELLAVVAILGVIVAIAVPVSLSYVRKSKDNAFYLNVQEVVKKVKMEHELNRARHCYHNIDRKEIAESDNKSFNVISSNTIGDMAFAGIVDENKVEHLSILSYYDKNDKAKYAVLAKEKDSDNWINTLDFDATTSEKSTWEDGGASYIISILSNITYDDEETKNYEDTNDELKNLFEGEGTKNELQKYIDDADKCRVDFKEGN